MKLRRKSRIGNNFGRLPRWAAAFWFLTWNAACGGSERGFDESSKWSVDPVGFASQDSAGIAILVTTGDLTSRRLGWNVSSEPNLVLGDGPDPGEQFFRIRGAAPLPKGGVAVLDGDSRELRFYDAEGNMVSRTGRDGSGPGEFREPRLVPLTSFDSLLVHDQTLRRVTAYAPDGTRLMQTPWPQPGRAPLGVLGGRALLERRPPIPVEELQRSGVEIQEPTYLWVDLTSGSEVPLRSYAVVRGFTYAPGPGEAYPSGRSIPFTALPTAVVTSGGAALTSGNSFEVLQFDGVGNLRRILRVDRPRRPVTRNDIRGVIDLELSESASAIPRSAYAQRFSEMPLPDSMPAFVGLEVDDLGWLWAQLYEWDTRIPTRWVVFAPDGQGRGIISLPPGLTVQHIGADFILGVWIDEDGVEHVHRHGLERN